MQHLFCAEILIDNISISYFIYNMFKNITINEYS